MASSDRTVRPCFIFAGGGSGGHLSPGLAIAERLEEHAANVRCLFLCSTRSIDELMLSEAGAEYIALPATPADKRPRALWQFVRNYRRSVQQAGDVLRAAHPTSVVALGGFVAAPVVSAAQASGVQTTLLNLDCPPGKANRMMARRADQVLSAVELPDQPTFAERVVGLPIRRRAIAPADQLECKARLGLDTALRALLVTGASQGAGSINDLMRYLAEHHAPRFTGWQILHLSGSDQDAALQEIYDRAGVPARVIPFLHEMGLAWGAADAAISRAGANSIAEVVANAVPTVFLPYPHHRDQHQRRNAQPLVTSGGALMVRDAVNPAANASAIARSLETLMHDATARASMSATLRHRHRGDAAQAVARLLLEPVTP